MADAIQTEIIRAHARTAQEGTARITTYTVADTPSPTEAALRGRGTVDFVARRAHVIDRMVTDWLQDQLKDRGAGRIVQGVLAAFAEPMEIVLDGQRQYTRREPGDPWVRTDDPVDGPRMSGDPLWAFDALTGANADAAVVDHPDLGGVPTTHWRLTLDLHRADAALPFGLGLPDTPAKRRRFRRPVDVHWEQHVPAEVWLDGEGCVRRIAAAPLVHRGKPGQQVLWHVTDLTDFGEPDAISVPEVAED